MTDTQNTNSQNASTSAPKRTPLYQSHVDSEGKLVDFSGWELPIHYGSQIEEHEAVRTDAGMFDVSHMVVADVKGSDTKAWLQKLLANDVDKLKTVGKALYSGMLNEQGGIIDDLIVYLMNTRPNIVSSQTPPLAIKTWHNLKKSLKVSISPSPSAQSLP